MLDLFATTKLLGGGGTGAPPVVTPLCLSVENILVLKFFQIAIEKDALCCKGKVAAVNIEKLKIFIIKCYDISKTYSIQFYLFGSVIGSVNLSYFNFFIHSFQSSILHKLKNTSNCRLKLNKDNNRSFLIACTTTSIK